MSPRRIRLSIAVCVASLALPTTGCLTLMGGEEKLGAEAARQVEVEMGIVEDPALEAYVRAIGERLAAHADRDGVTWRFRIVDMKEPNAFALPGGFIYVSRGLLALVNDEAELAGVIGHEIGHVTAGHGNKRVTLSAPFKVLTGITGWATGIVSPTLGNAVAGAGDTLAEGLVIAPFSRNQEREADRIGAALAARAGWEPGSLGDFLVTLGRFEALATGEERRQSWLDSHPPSPERAAALREFVSGLERAAPNPVARDRADLFARLDGLMLGEDPGRGVLLGDRFVHPDLGFSLRFPPGWSVANSPAAVAAQEPGGQAAVVLQMLAVDRTLDEAIAEVREQDARISFDRFQVNGLPAARTRVQQRGHTLDVTWVEHRENVYQLAGIVETRAHAGWEGSFRKTVESLRDARPDEIARIEARRLRIAEAGGGESLEALLRRVGSEWTPPLAAVANGVEEGDALVEGRLVKYGRKERFAP